MLEFRSVRKAYGSTVAVDDLTLSIETGEILGLLGPNGAGKSTAVGLAVGWLSPDSGAVELRGHGSPARRAVRARIGIAPQALALYEELTGEENLSFFGRIHGLSGRRLVERVDAALAFVGLTDRRGDRARTYSGGMKRRLNLAAALVHDPEVLLLDEPTVGVDPQSRHAILDQVQALKSSGKTVVYTTHYMEEAERLCDRVAVVDHGRILALGTVDELLAAHGGNSVVVSETDLGEERVETSDPVAEIARRFEAGRPHRIRIERPDLESVFLHLTGRTLRD